MALTQLSFDATFYMTERPDVLTAYVKAGAEVGTGMNWAQFAEQHYNDFGWKEGYNPNAIFVTKEYLAANTDVLDAGVNPFQHYLQFGAYEMRAPSDSFISFEDFDWETYLAANSDLTDAGIETAEEAYGHFVVYGQFEDRPGAPVVEDPATKGETYNLTIGVDEYTGTAKNDTFNAVPVNAANSDKATTLNAWDSIDGGAGVDTLNIYTDKGTAAGEFNTTQQGTVKNIEIINIHNKEGAVFADTAGIDASKFEGSTEIWQHNFATDVNKVGSQTVGFRNSALNDSDAHAVTAADGAKSLSVALDKVASGFELELAGKDVTTLNISGSIVANADKTPGALEFFDLGTKVTTLNLAMTSGADIALHSDAVSDFTKIKALNASASTGDLIVEIEGYNGGSPAATLALESLTLGSGKDTLKFDAAGFSKDVSIDTGAGADKIEVILKASKSAISVAGNAGADTFTLTGGNIAFNDGDLEGSVTITDFGNGDDVLVLGTAFEGFSAQTAVNNAIADVESLEEAIAALDTLTGGTPGANITKFAQFVYDGNTYVYGNINTAADTDGAGDTLIGFTGIVDLNNDNVVAALPV